MKIYEEPDDNLRFKYKMSFIDHIIVFLKKTFLLPSDLHIETLDFWLIYSPFSIERF